MSIARAAKLWLGLVSFGVSSLLTLPAVADISVAHATLWHSHAQTAGQFRPSMTFPEANWLDEHNILGNIYAAWQWQDQSGNNLAILTTAIATATNQTPSDRNDPNNKPALSQTLRVYHVRDATDGFKVVRQLTDFERNCPLDLQVGFRPQSVTITDLNANGLAEIGIAYTLGCTGDISPPAMKFMLLEDGEKYALRGTMNAPQLQLNDAEKTTQGIGLYQIDSLFANAPSEFLPFAKQRWADLQDFIWE